MPVYEPGPSPTATHSTCSRSRFAERSASSAMTMPPAMPEPDSITSLSAPASFREPGRTTATLRCGEENSNARIVIGNPPFGFAHGVELHRAIVSWQFLIFDFRFLIGIEPAFSPLNHGDAGRV